MKLAAYAAFRSRNLYWRTGSDVALAKGLMPEDIAARAIVSVIGGERKWEPERGPLLPFLKRVVDSLLITWPCLLTTGELFALPRTIGRSMAPSG